MRGHLCESKNNSEAERRSSSLLLYPELYSLETPNLRPNVGLEVCCPLTQHNFCRA